MTGPFHPFRLRRVRPDEAGLARAPAVPRDVLMAAVEIIDQVERDGLDGLKTLARQHDGWEPEQPLVHRPEDLRAALDETPSGDRTALERAASGIRSFAEAQLASVTGTDVSVAGGRAGDRVVPVRVAGCYAPGGRYPLPSSVLMTAVVARVAGVEEVWVASPQPSRAVLAAAAISEADGLLAAGGAHAVAACAFGTGPVPRCDVVVGPGNHWVTAAKLLLSGVVGIDMLAGPSELVVLAGAGARAELVALDLLAQAEHDPAALPILVSTIPGLVEATERALGEQLVSLPTAEVARRALAGGFAVEVETAEEAIAVCQSLAPEHLQLHGDEALLWAERLDSYGALFVGSGSAEVFGDYGVGPNHTLPTGGSARFASGLSVHAFLRRPTWLHLSAVPDSLVRDTATLARMEGLEAHARAAEARVVTSASVPEDPPGAV